LGQSSSQFLETIEVSESLVELGSSSNLSSVVSDLSVKLISEFTSFSACSTKGEDHLPEVAFSSSSLLLQIGNLGLSCIDSFLKFFLDDLEDVVEVV
jgi:hypothetical protein